ncbi:hypothetical protein Hdeb2414_s0112g00798431 [Helianthus debilis subsp. tardiflorus]
MHLQPNGGRLFKFNFLAYWKTLFVEITKSTTVKQSFLLASDKEEDISKLDWCSFVLDSLKRTRQGWKKFDSQYNGPVAFLTLLYAHEYNKRHNFFKEVIEMPVIKYMTGIMVDDLEEHIYNNGPLTDVEDIFENDEQRHRNETQTHGDDQAQQLQQQDQHPPQVQEHLVASDNEDHEQQEAAKTSTEVLNKYAYQPSTLLEDLFHDNIPVHEAATVEGNTVRLEKTGDSTTDEFTIPPVDTAKVYKRRNEREKDPNDECYIPSTSDFFDDWYEVRDISELNLVTGIGTQTQKLIDYCSTPIQLAGVPCDDGAREASKKNKKVHYFEIIMHDP